LRIYYASDGRVSYIKRLLATALREVLQNDIEKISPEILEKAFTNEIWWEGTGALNPFNQRFEFRRLDRGGEPFESGTLGSAGKRRATSC